MNAPTQYQIEELYLNLTIEERVEFNDTLAFANYFGWKNLEAKLLAQHWMKYGYLAYKFQEKNKTETPNEK